MAIYRPPKPRWRAGALGAAAGLVAGLGIGFALGSPNQPDLDAAVATMRASLVRASGSLEIVAIEYEEAVANDEVVSESEYEGSLAAERSSEAEFANVSSALAELIPERVAAIKTAYGELESAMTRLEDPDDIQRLVDELERLLKE